MIEAVYALPKSLGQYIYIYVGVCLFQIDTEQKPNTKYLSEYFTFLFDFARMGEEECSFLLQINAIHKMVSFYTGHKMHENYVSIEKGRGNTEEGGEY